MVSISMAFVDTHSNTLSIEKQSLYSKPNFTPFQNLKELIIIEKL